VGPVGRATSASTTYVAYYIHRARGRDLGPVHLRRDLDAPGGVRSSTRRPAPIICQREKQRVDRPPACSSTVTARRGCRGPAGAGVFARARSGASSSHPTVLKTLGPRETCSFHADRDWEGRRHRGTLDGPNPVAAGSPLSSTYSGNHWDTDNSTRSGWRGCMSPAGPVASSSTRRCSRRTTTSRRAPGSARLSSPTPAGELMMIYGRLPTAESRLPRRAACSTIARVTLTPRDCRLLCPAKHTQTRRAAGAPGVFRWGGCMPDRQEGSCPGCSDRRSAVKEMNRPPAAPS